jgi:hypothetical protein
MTSISDAHRPLHPMGRALEQRDRRVQERIFGAYLPSAIDAVALRDARGHRFQRLEWLGDSVLDLLVIEHVVYARVLPLECCAQVEFDSSDRTLGAAALRTGVAELADWELTWHRAADLAEAMVGAAFRAHGWAGARHAAGALHLGLSSVPRPAAPPVVARRLACELGAQVFDTSVSISAYAEYPNENEAQLSAFRASGIENSVRAGIAEVAGLRQAQSHTRAEIADDLDEALGAVCLQDGLEHAVAIASEIAGSRT